VNKEREIPFLGDMMKRGEEKKKRREKKRM
jgi:hypothetical protein